MTRFSSMVGSEADQRLLAVVTEIEDDAIRRPFQGAGP